MRRVVVTGMGIVSSIGNNTQEVLASLREAKSGIIEGRGLREIRLPLPGARRAHLNPEELVDRRAMRFHGAGHGLEPCGDGSGHRRLRASRPKTSPTSAPASSWARAAPPPGPSSKPPTSPAKRAPSASAPSRCRRRCPRPPPRRSRPGSRSRASTTRSPPPARPPTIASATPTRLIQMGKQDVMFAGGCEDLDWTMSNLFDAMGAMSVQVQRHPVHGIARL